MVDGMTEDEKKRVTIWLGECWHETYVPDRYEDGVESGIYVCNQCEELINFDDIDVRRTFTTWQDYGDCFEKIVVKGEWRDFYIRARDIFCNDFMVVCLRDDMEAEYNTWLHSRTESGEFRLCQLTADTIKEGVIGK
jgi:hypothetical protein